MSEIVFPDGIDARGKAGLWALPAVANLRAVTMAEVSAGFAVSCAIYNWAPNADQPATTDARYCSRTNTESAGSVTTTVEPINYVYDPQNPDAATGPYAHYGKFVEGSLWFFLDRRGLDFDQALASGQVYDLYVLRAGYRNRLPVVPGEDGTKLRVSQKFFVQRDPVQDGKIAA